MKPEQIKRIAKIVCGEDNTRQADDGTVYVQSNNYWVVFRPHKDWETTGIVLEWLRSKCRRLEISGSIIYFDYGVNTPTEAYRISTQEQDKDLKAAICKVTLAVGASCV